MSVAERGIYHCEICRTKVDWNAKTCPLCGALFVGALCPQCGNMGSSRAFLDGCPKCGNSRERKLASKTTDQRTAPQEDGRHGKDHHPWRSSLYWVLSLSLIVLVGFIMAHWLKS